jgi:hypothetical protein
MAKTVVSLDNSSGRMVGLAHTIQPIEFMTDLGAGPGSIEVNGVPADYG